MAEKVLTLFRNPDDSMMFSNRDLFHLIAPLTIEQILLMLVGMVDTIMISYVGEAAVSGVSLVDMINNLFITVFAAIATGGAVIVSQYIGAQNPKMANKSASQLILISLAISTLITVVCLLGNELILRTVYGSVEADVMAASRTYFYLTALSYPFLGVYNAGAALFRSMKKTNVTMNVSLLSNTINIVGNYIGIFVLHAGVAGVAVPTLLARAVSAAVILVMAFSHKNEISVNVHDIVRFDPETSGRIVKIALPNGIENGLFMLGKVLVTSIVALFGTYQIAANGISNSINQIAIFVVQAVNLAMVTVVGQCVGAREYDQARYYTKKLMMISYLSTALLSLAVWAAMPLLLGLYEMSDQTYHLTYILIMMHNLLALALHPTSFNLSNTLRAAGDVQFTMVAGILSMIVFRLGCAYLFGVILNMGIIGVWIAMGADWLGRSIAFVFRYRTGKWTQIQSI